MGYQSNSYTTLAVTMKDFYYLLGADVNATPEEVREAFRQLSRRFADVDDDDVYARNHYRDISEAFAVLSDATRRMRYDAALKRAGLYPGQQKPHGRAFTSVDIAFTVVLILITLLFGDYVVRSITGAKKTPAQLASAKPLDSESRPKKPLKKKGMKVAFLKPEKVPQQIKGWQPIKVSEKIVQRMETRSVPDYSKAITTPASIPVTTAPAYLYAAYVQPAARGAIYMRKDDHYGSKSVTIIPENSRVEVLDDSNAFYKVKYNSTTGYILKSSVIATVLNNN